MIQILQQGLSNPSTSILTLPSDPSTAPVFPGFCDTSAVFPTSSVLPSPAKKLPLNLNYGIAGHPLNPLASIPSPYPRASSLEVTVSFTLAFFSSDSEIPASQVEGVEKMCCSNKDVEEGASRSSSQFVVASNGFVSSSPSVLASL